VEGVVVLEVRTGVATRARGAGGRRLQANELAAPVPDEVAESENGRMALHAAGSCAKHAKKGFLVRLVVVAIHIGYFTIARDEHASAFESSR